MYFLAIDLGTSFIKGALLDPTVLDPTADPTAESLRHPQRRPFPAPLPDLPPRFFEVEPAAVVAAVRELIGDLLTAAGDDGRSCAGLLACSQMHGFLLTDEQGEPLSNVITWRDERAALPHPNGGTYFEALMARLNGDEPRALGNGLRPGLPAGALFWLAQNKQLPADAVVASLPDWVLAQLCAQHAGPVIEATNAAAYGLLDAATRQWHRDVIQKLELGHLRWPTIRPVDEIVGTLDLNGLDVPTYPAVGDHQAALLGTNLVAGELSLNVATGAQASLIASDYRAGNYEVRPYFGGAYLQTLANVPAGRALGALVDLLTELARAEGVDLRDPWGTIEREVNAVGQTDLAVDLSFFAAASASGAGHITNLHEGNLAVGHLFRAAFARVADDLHKHAQRLAPAGDEEPWSQIAFSGGLVQRLAVLRELIAARFGCGYRLSTSSEDTLLGLLSLARSVGAQIKRDNR